MKQLFRFWIVAALLLMVGCSMEYDDSALVGRIDDLESRVQSLEQLCQQMNTNISSLQTIVTALQNNDYVTGVTPITENGKTIGYTITFAKAQSITIYHGKDGQNGADGKDGQDGADGKDGADGAPGKDGENGKDGADGKDGKDGYTPIIGVKQDTDGIYYWTLDGEWLIDDAGNKIKAVGTDGKDGADGEPGKDGQDGAPGKDGENGTDGKDGADGQPGQNGATGPQGEQGPQGASGKDGITPMLKIENDYWYISYDNGATWTQLGKATGEDGKDGIDGTNGTNGTDGVDGKSFFQDVTQDDNNVYLTLADGTVITVPKGLALSIAFDEADLVVMSPNSTRQIGYTVTSATESAMVEVTSSADIKAKVVADNENGLTGKIEIKTSETIDEYSKVIVFVSNGDKVIMRSITFEEAGLQVEENATKEATAEGGELILEFLSNVACEAVIPEEAQDWISVVPATRALEKQTITLKLEPNEGAARSAEIEVKSIDGELSLTYTVWQDANANYQLALEREALIAFYNAMDGDNWTNNENWCSDKPVSEWYGVICGESFIWALQLGNNNLKGEIPNEIGNLSNIQLLELDNNQISGMVPKEMRKLNKLHSLNLSYTDISGPFFEGIEGLCDLESLQLIGCPNITSISENIKYLQKLSMLRVSGIISKRINCSLPSTIGECKALRELEFAWANAENEIPRSIGALSNLTYLHLFNANYKGSIPVEISNCHNLKVLDLQENNLSGGLPTQIGKMNSLRQIILMKNHLTGDIPKSLLDNKTLWSRCWAMVMYGNNFNNCYIPAPQFTVKGYYGNTINSESLYKSNKYTALIQTNLDSDINSQDINILKEIYDKYKEHGLNVVDCVSYHMCAGQEYNIATQYVENYNIPWEVVVLTDDNNLFSADYNLSGWGSWYPLNDSPGIVLIDNSGEVIMYSSRNYGDTGYAKLDNYLSEYLLGIIPTLPYESTDYTKDGSYRLLQRAQTGNGIDIVLMGDGYSDRLIESGDYDNTMDQAMNMFFSNEPYKSYRDLFNVYAVYAVSANEGFETGRESTALNSSFMGGTLIEGNAEKVFKYALKVIDEERMDNASIIVVLNSTNYAGTCYYFNGEYCDYGSGISISYVPIQDGLELFGSTILHEACGHGFAKLADEYAYEGMGEVPSDYVSQIQSQQDNWGWWKNVDFTSDLSAIRWSHFINDTRYTNEGLGAYEGGLTYWTGVWRPTENSIMRYNTGGFNAPSREAIYYRIHKLAYGDSWEYDYEDFVGWDARNRTTAATRAMVYKPTNYKPTHPPVIVNKSWKDAK